MAMSVEELDDIPDSNWESKFLMKKNNAMKDGHSFEIHYSRSYLKELLEECGYACFYTGKLFNNFQDITFERIDPVKGYIRGNVAFVKEASNKFKGINFDRLLKMGMKQSAYKWLDEESHFLPDAIKDIKEAVNEPDPNHYLILLDTDSFYFSVVSTLGIRKFLETCGLDLYKIHIYSLKYGENVDKFFKLDDVALRALEVTDHLIYKSEKAFEQYFLLDEKEVEICRLPVWVEKIPVTHRKALALGYYMSQNSLVSIPETFKDWKVKHKKWTERKLEIKIAS